ncbi:uncharacterized protein LOC121242234 [Juglans microcarpa x Juglans regia]|uniref:uncharacterized protein LOC121242234 n=1 Tax=Juglans microcarpa x Juglans regia TaxID=2249226 RepID=UPI001B7E8C08|nr:uncharacterized protein LOC121242234 [Juglans microcarpa x Juglans regia]
MAIGASIRCGQIGHMIWDCLQITHGGASTPSAKPKIVAKAKVYAITPGEVDLEADETADAGVITGASRSFISSRCVRQCELKAEPMSQKVLVAISDGKVISCTSVVKNCLLEIANLVLIADLIVFHLIEFDLLLGKQWLSRHYAKIDC